MKRYDRAYLKKHPEKLGKDLETARKACEHFQEVPVALFNFMEGTRFTRAKHEKQRSSFAHLLKPKAAATGLILDCMGEQLHTLVDITIRYDGQVPDFWDFLCGRGGQVNVMIEKLPIPEELLSRDYAKDSDFRRKLQRWVAELWLAKDQKLVPPS
jgi:1-acyl-sn-glycerol-3-phosphate acyltransferase